ncbi:MAG TPA: DMT family transporter [Thermomicrobiales bacterium]
MSAHLAAEPAGAARARAARDRRGYALGLLGVLAFSLTVPLTRYAVPDFGPIVVGLGRGLLASFLAAAILAARREPIPQRQAWPIFLRVALGVTIGFPILTAIALEHLPSNHGAVVTGLQPAATAVFAALRAGEHPPRRFWLTVALGMFAVLAFASAQGAGLPQRWDLLLFLAMAASSFGHVEAARLARRMGGWRVISWTLICAAPILAVPVAISASRIENDISLGAWAALLCLAAFPAYLGFFPWYRGMTLAGIARVGQLQLLQPLLSFAWAMVLLDERLDLWTTVTALAVIASIALSRRAWQPPAAAPSSSSS